MADKFNKIRNLEKLFKQRTLLDIAIEVEKFFDFLQLYVYPNWIDGEIVEGPKVGRYWITLVLCYPYKKMPDPMGARILHDVGAKVEYSKGTIMEPIDIKKPEDYRPGTKKPKLEPVKVWYVEMKIPRRFIDNIDYNELDEFEDEIDIDEIEDATDQGINSDTVNSEPHNQNTPTEQIPNQEQLPNEVI